MLRANDRSHPTCALVVLGCPSIGRGATEIRPEPATRRVLPEAPMRILAVKWDSTRRRFSHGSNTFGDCFGLRLDFGDGAAAAGGRHLSSRWRPFFSAFPGQTFGGELSVWPDQRRQ